MNDINQTPEPDTEAEHFPIEPRYHPIHKIPRIVYDFLASAKLAMVLLIAILACCLVGVTIFRGVEAGTKIFGTIWFNGLLVLLVINVACCFFGRIWGRRVTLISFGMILFHLSFVFMFLAIVYNSLFFFRGIIRLTEGETLSNSDPQSYDVIEKGRLFHLSKLRGETSLLKMHTDYKVDGEDKRAAYEVAIGERGDKKQGIIYITQKLSYRGVEYFNEKEGYTLLVTLSDRNDKELYGAFLALQSIRLKDNSYQYTTGYKDGDMVHADAMPFPQKPEQPRFAMQAIYEPSKLQERSGDVRFKLYPLDDKQMPQYDSPLADGKTAIGKPFVAGEYVLSAREVRYWVGMQVRYEPGKPVVLTSLWVGLFGMVLTTIGRMLRKSSRRSDS